MYLEKLTTRIYKPTASINSNYSPIEKACGKLLQSSDVLCNFQNIKKDSLQKYLKSLWNKEYTGKH